MLILIILKNYMAYFHEPPFFQGPSQAFHTFQSFNYHLPHFRSFGLAYQHQYPSVGDPMEFYTIIAKNQTALCRN